MLWNFLFKNIPNHFGGWWQNNQVLGWAYNANTPRKLPWEKQSSPKSTIVIFKSLPLRHINGHHESIFQGKQGYLGIKNKSLVIKGIHGTNTVPHWAILMILKTLSIWNQKIRVAVNTNNNFTFKKSNNENKLEINYRKLRTKRILN